MMIHWPSLPSSRAERSKLIFFICLSVAAILLGFVLVPPALAGRLIARCGYYYILGVFVLWLYFARRVAKSLWTDSTAWLQREGLAVGAFLVAATAFAVWSDSFAHKLLFDEYVLQGSTWHMHLTKEVGTPIRAYDFEGTWLTIDTFLDKRPYFFTFLVSLIHDLTGFRLANVFALNVALAFVVLASVFWLVREITARLGPALLAVALLATLPLFGQNATGGSMEMLNLAMIAVLMVAATLYHRAPSLDRLSFLVLGAVLLAQSRYESVLFVFPVATLIILGWVRTGRVFLSWPAIIAPFLLIPYTWHDRYVTANQHLWQLREGEQSRFALQYLAGNLDSARKFFSSTSPLQPTSLWLVLLGTAGIAWALIRLWRVRQQIVAFRFSPAAPVIALFALAIVANLGLLMFYYWSRLDEPVTARFALPLFLLFSVAAGWFVHSLDSRGIPALRIAAIGLLAWLLVIAAPAYAQRLYTTRNLVLHELEWEVEKLTRTHRPDFLITSKATMPFLLERIPTINTSIARLRGPQLAWHMRHGTFREVLVSQVIRPTSAEGDATVDPEDELPENFRLETLAIKRFGARWLRISRLKAIELAGADEMLLPVPVSR